jgi:subtilase family serine protease
MQMRRRNSIGMLALAATVAMSGSAAAAAGHSQRAVCPGPPFAGDARCLAHVITDSRGTPLTVSAPPMSWYGPAQFHGAYALPSTPASGAPAQTIAIVDAYDDPTIAKDLAAYDEAYKLKFFPSCKGLTTWEACFAKVNQAGAAGSYPKANSGWALEIALDVETAHEICQSCRVLLVEASSSSGANLDAAEGTAYRLGATEISNSWGSESEYSGELTENAHFNHPNVVVTVASGDRGYNSFGFPAASPDVVDAGGTTLRVTSNGAGVYGYGGETTWSGSGSGCSAFFGAKPWQSAALNWSLTGCGSARGVSDVAADANPETGTAVYDTTKYIGHSGWFHVGGTSLASPLIASVYALAGNAANATVDPSGYPASIPYAHVSALHDVTEGAATGNCSTTACKAGKGYDGPTGVGTPNGIAGF